MSGDADLVVYTLRLADDALLMAQRAGEWIAAAPELEEDVALANIGLDYLGQARALLTYAADLQGGGGDEDTLAYLRDEREFTNAQLCELPNGDFAFTIARLLAFSSYQYELYHRLVDSSDDTLAAVAAKAVKEVQYHRDHASSWTLRLGDGTDESHRRMQAGLEAVWPFVDELFVDDQLAERVAECAIGVLPSTLRASFDGYVDETLVQATLVRPSTTVRHDGGRRGIHTEHLGYLLAEMQYLARSHPGGDLVTATRLEQARSLAASVVDPEIPVLTLDDLGILRDVSIEDDSRVIVTVTPTYSGCPAMEAIQHDVRSSLRGGGFDDVEVRLTLTPAWTTDWMSDDGRRKLQEYGIAPPTHTSEPGLVALSLAVRCPQCGSLDTRELSRFGSTACKALWVCGGCREPFDRFKSI